jgi:hypothetical protein
VGDSDNIRTPVPIHFGCTHASARDDITAEWASQVPVTIRRTISNGVFTGAVGEEGVDFLVISAAKR